MCFLKNAYFSIIISFFSIIISFIGSKHINKTELLNKNRDPTAGARYKSSLVTECLQNKVSFTLFVSLINWLLLRDYFLGHWDKFYWSLWRGGHCRVNKGLNKSECMVCLPNGTEVKKGAIIETWLLVKVPPYITHRMPIALI